MTKRRSDLTLKPPLSVLPHPAPGALPAPAHAIPTTAPMPQLPPPTLDALPGPAHAIVATMLPNGDQARNRLRLSLVSRSMLGFHGGTLTVLGVRSITDQQAATLASLVQRQRSLERLCFEDSETFPVVTTILTQGALRRVRELILELPPKDVHGLAEAMQALGALDALELLAFRKTKWASGTIQLLADALASGAAPSLRSLDLGDFGAFSNDDAEALAVIMEAQHTGPRNLSPATPAEETDGGENATITPPVEVLEGMPALEELTCECYQYEDDDQVMDIEPVILALSRGVAFQQLQKLKLNHSQLEGSGWDRLFAALAGANCAEHLTHISITICPEFPSATLSRLLGQDTSPMLQALDLSNNFLFDEGVTNLTQGLLAASRTSLKMLGLINVDVGDGGMAALARVLRAGCFERLEHIYIDDNDDVTSPGARALVRALEDPNRRGLPMLSHFNCVLAVPTMGVRALERAVIENCPRLEQLTLCCRDGYDDEWDMWRKLEEMVHAAGCQHRARIYLENVRFNDEREGTWKKERDWTDEDDWLADGDNRILTRDGSEDHDDEDYDDGMLRAPACTFGRWEECNE